MTMSGFHKHSLLLTDLIPKTFLFSNCPSEHHLETLGNFICSLRSMTQQVLAIPTWGQRERFLIQTCFVAVFIQTNSGLAIPANTSWLLHTGKKKHLSFIFPTVDLEGCDWDPESAGKA